MNAFAPLSPPGQDPDLLRRVVARGLAPRAAVDRAAPPADALRRYAAAATPDTMAAADGLAEAWVELGVTVHVVGGPGYPTRLARRWPSEGVPAWLAVRGPAWPDERPAVAIVGSRRATGYGAGVAAWLADEAARAGAVVVSGGALGVDAAAHEAAVGAGDGSTAVVLGCGHGVGYPSPHASPGGLFDRILDAGGWLLSAAAPAAPPRPFRVRGRNRIVAALADAVVVVEGGDRSGTLVTASDAADLGVPVLAVPGDVRAPGSHAPHLLLAEGAAPCRGPSDLLDALGLGASSTSRSGVAPPPLRLPVDLARVLRDRWPRPVTLDELAEACDRPVGALLAELTRARLRGELAEGVDGVRLRRAPA